MTELESYGDYAKTALTAYKTVVDPTDAQGDETNIVDLMADLMHLAEQKGYDVQALVNLAVFHYEADREEMEEGT